MVVAGSGGALLPLGARGGAGGVALSPWWWAWVCGGAFPLVASRVGVGVEWWCGQ